MEATSRNNTVSTMDNNKNNNTPNPLVPTTTTSNARSWFETLGPEECAAAVSFRDGPFLTSFLHLATTPTKTPKQQKQQHLKTTTASMLMEDAFDTKNWTTMSVDQKEWAETYSRFDQQQQQPTAISAAAAATTTTVKEEGVAASAKTEVPTTDAASIATDTNRTTATATTINANNMSSLEEGSKEFDAFRIRGSQSSATLSEAKDTASPSAIAIATSTTSTSSTNKKEPVVLSPSAQEIANNVSVIFPSDFAAPTATTAQAITATTPPPPPPPPSKTTTNASNSDGIPFVTLHPIFVITKSSTGSMVTALDQLLQELSGDVTNSFLSTDDWPEEWLKDGGKNSVDKMCWHRLQSLGKTATEQKAPVLLFLVLLVRIEVAVHLACMEATSPPPPLPSKDKEGAPAALGPQGYHTKPLSELVEKLECVAKLVKMESLDTSKLKDIVSPLVDGGFCFFPSDDGGGEQKSTAEQNLLTAPLPSVVQLFSCLLQTKSDNVDWKSWDNVWNATLQKVRDHTLASNLANLVESALLGGVSSARVTVGVSSDGGDNNGEDELGTEWMDVNTPSASSTAASTLTAKKNKKKRKKKNKKNKGSSTNNNAGATSTSATTAEDTPTPAGNLEDASELGSPEQQQPAEDVETSIGDTSTSLVVPAAAETSSTVAERLTAGIVEAHLQREMAAPAEAILTEEEDSDTMDIHNTTSSFDSGKLPSDETASTKSSASTKPEEHGIEYGEKAAGESDLSVSRVHGVGTVVVAPSSAATSSGGNDPSVPANGNAFAGAGAGDQDEWETVEVKGRGSRKKSGRSTTHQASKASQTKKNKTKTPESRSRIKHRKLVKEILSSVLDSVDEEIRRRPQQQQARSMRTAGSTATPPVAAWKGGNRAAGLPEGARKTTALKSVVRQGALDTQKQNVQSVPQKEARQESKKIPQAVAPAAKKKSTTGAPPVKSSKGPVAGADQHTATTIPETVSAVSDARRTQSNTSSDVRVGDSSSSGSGENRKLERAPVPMHTEKHASPVPPLPTLLNPGNGNSSSSSVASSLEAPNASQGHRHTASSNEKDVGYHLLDVCDRLTRDMHVFMAHRASALNTRRRERGLLLGALQDSVSSIWAGQSHVELYGSCATMLDLPSSDLDVVICGLDQMDAAMNVSSTPPKNMVNFNGNMGENVSPDNLSQEPQMGHHSHAMPQYAPIHHNSDKILCLAAELERQPWAVLVKAIPTASVPVVKVLADPSRLPSIGHRMVVDGEAWTVNQQPQMQPQPATDQNTEEMAESAPLPSDASPTNASPAKESVLHGDATPFQASMPLPVWRGADVDNGLIKLDITFEGPEHGGIGSTEFSARVVQNICDETGLTPENTAFVQVIMVVKELLAQRRLNEPFSGGLSSYSLLLLVLSVMCERKVIQEELDRVARQSRVVAAGGGNLAVSGSSGDKSQSDDTSNNTKEDNQEIATKSSVAPNSAAGTKSRAKGTAAKKEVNGTQTAAQAPGKLGESTKRAQAGNQQKAGNPPKGKSQGNARGAAQHQTEGKPTKKSAGNSWASIAMGKNDPAASTTDSAAKKGEAQDKKVQSAGKKPSSFADAVARKAAGPAQGQPSGKAAGVTQQPVSSTPGKATNGPSNKGVVANDAKRPNKKQTSNTKRSQETPTHSNNPQQKAVANVDKKGTAANKATAGTEARKIDPDEKTSKFNNYSSEPPTDPTISSNQSVFPQGFNDVIEVLCSGETTPGKLLMHFLLFYGQHFEAHATAIDISGKHHREIPPQSFPYTHPSPYLQRRSAGSIDPVTGMLTVDPIVVYDPLEGAENNNVARRCFLWGSVRWVFSQSFMTLSSAVERNTTPPDTPGPPVTKEVTDGSESNPAASSETNGGAKDTAAWSGPYNATDKVEVFDQSSPLLELLLSF